MASVGSIFGPARKRVGSETSQRVEAAKVARLRHAKMEYLKGAEKEDDTMFVGYRKLDLTRKSSSMDSSGMDDGRPKKIPKKGASHEEKAKRDWYEHEKHRERIQITKQILAEAAFLSEEKLFSFSIFKAFQGPKFRSVQAYQGKPENLSSPWEANYQSCERYEEDLSLLLQDFEAKSRHEFAVTGRWPVQAEVGALFLACKLRGKEWRKVKNNGTYMESLDNAWRAKINKFKEEKIFQVVWEYVAGMSRGWDNQRHPESYVVKHGVVLRPMKSTQRKQQFIDVDQFTRIKRHGGIHLDKWPIRRPTNEFSKYRR